MEKDVILEKDVIFREVQDLQKNIFWIFILYPALLFWYFAIKRFVFNEVVGTRSIPDPFLLSFWFIFGVFFPLMLFCTKHITEVRRDGIYIRFAPLNRSFKKIPFYVVEGCKIQKYEPFAGEAAEQKKTPLQKLGPVVILQLISGKKMMITSRKPEELCRAIRQASGQA